MKGKILEFRGNKEHPIRYAIRISWNGTDYKFWHYPDGSGDPIYHRDIAEALLTQVRGAIDLHNKGRFTFRPEFYQKKSPLSLEAYAKVWLDSYPASKKMTKKGYRAAIKHAIEYEGFGAKFDIRGFSLSNLQTFYNKLTYQKTETGENGEKKTVTLPMSVKGRYNVLTAIKTMLRYAFRDGKLDKLPAFPVLENPAPLDTPYLIFQEQQEILSHIPERHRPIYEMGMEYGFRIEEVRALKWDCISETHITIRRSMPEYELLETTKEGDARVEEITTRARDILRRARLNPSWKGYVFTASKRGAPYDYKFMARTWKAACEKVGIEIKMYNGFRHSYCGQLADLGIPAETIQRCVGHKDRRSTERYTRRQRASERRAINEMRGQVIPINKKTVDIL